MSDYVVASFSGGKDSTAMVQRNGALAHHVLEYRERMRGAEI